MVKCNCKSGCKTMFCKCIRYGISCGDRCGNDGFCNMKVEAEEEVEEFEGDEQDAEYVDMDEEENIDGLTILLCIE